MRTLNFTAVVYLHSFFLSFFFFSLRLFLAVADWMSTITSTHDVRIYNAGLKHAARGSPKIQDAKLVQKIAICPPSHNFVRLYLRS